MKLLYQKSLITGIVCGIFAIVVLELVSYAIGFYILNGGDSETGGNAMIWLFYLISFIFNTIVVGFVVATVTCEDGQKLTDILKASLISGTVTYTMVMGYQLYMLGISPSAPDELLYYVLGMGLFVVIFGLALPFMAVSSVIGAIVFTLFARILKTGLLSDIIHAKTNLLSGQSVK